MGKIYNFYGNGKGKTTSAIGMGIRASGHGINVIFHSYLKGPLDRYYGEINYLSNKNRWYIEQFGSNNIPYDGCIDEETVKSVTEGYTNSRGYIYGIRSDIKPPYLLILDELNTCFDLRLLDVNSVVKDLISFKSLCYNDVDIVITGRLEKPHSMAIFDVSDVITKMDNIKHYYNDPECSIKCRKGFEH